MEPSVLIVLLCVTNTLADFAQVANSRAILIRDVVKKEISVSGRVVGGTEANISDLPYQLSLREYGDHICGASVIDSQLAITAAHCVATVSAVDTITLKGGSGRLSDNTQGVIFAVCEIIVHPNYNNATYNNDVALLRIVDSFVGHENIAPIQVPKSPIYATSSRPVYCSVSGWGLTSPTSDTADDLRRVRIPLVLYNECRRKWNPLPVTASMICAGEPRRDSCNGDSGGPLVCNNRLYGIVSWGDTNCGSSYPGVYASITSSDVLKFISKYVGLYDR